MHEGPDHEDFRDDYIEGEGTSPFYANCAFCKGTAVHPASMKLLSHKLCPVCNAHGTIEFAGYRREYISCARCSGAGREPDSSPVEVCHCCAGRGFMKITIS